ncbi:MAG TPA: ORF6N domain-containing protein [Chryseolinea sp.]|nr:ORF6N domain-containing protein [Chryseolinea sp.]
MSVRNKESIPISDEVIIDRIFLLRNCKVMIDRDLADLYGVTPRRLREQVKRNQKRFPAHFMFQLSETEAVKVSQFATPSRKKLGGSLPYAFTEHGVLMLASVLKSERALEVSLRVIELFVKMREMLSAQKSIVSKLAELEKKLMGHDADIKLIFHSIRQLIASPASDRRRIGYRRSNEPDK